MKTEKKAVFRTTKAILEKSCCNWFENRIRDRIQIFEDCLQFVMVINGGGHGIETMHYCPNCGAEIVFEDTKKKG